MAICQEKSALITEPSNRRIVLYSERLLWEFIAILSRKSPWPAHSSHGAIRGYCLREPARMPGPGSGRFLWLGTWPDRPGASVRQYPSPPTTIRPYQY